MANGGIGGVGHGPYSPRDPRMPDIGDGGMEPMVPGQRYEIQYCPATEKGEPRSFVDYFVKSLPDQEKDDTGAIEEMMRGAYTHFRHDVPQHIVTGIDDHMLLFLGIEGAPGGPAADVTMEEIHEELFLIESKGLINSEERELIEMEIGQFIEYYQAAFPDMQDEAYLLARDNARKLAYQTARDKEVFSGSDHGTKHIIEGNIRLAEQMIKGLTDQGFNMTALDRVLIHQAIIDHDLGYTTHEAQTSFLASKDHPLVGAAYLDTHQAYYDMYFPGCREALFDAVLNHSYPTWNLNAAPGAPFNANLLRSVTSTVDALGVSANIKCLAFFREPDVIVELQRLQYAKESGLIKEPKFPHSMDDTTKTFIEQTKENLRTLLEQKTELSPTRRQMILEAIENNVTPSSAERLLPQYAGRVEGVAIEDRGQGNLVPVVDMRVSQEHLVLSDIFGDETAFAGLEKALEDFKIDGALRRQLRDVIRSGLDGRREVVDVDTPLATFRFHPRENVPDPKLAGVFEDMRQFSIRGEFAQLREVVAELVKEDAGLERALDGVQEDLVLPDFRPRLERAAMDFLHQVESAVNLSPEDRDDLEVFVARLSTAPTMRDADRILKEGYTTTREREFIARIPIIDLQPPSIDDYIRG